MRKQIWNEETQEYIQNQNAEEKGARKNRGSGERRKTCGEKGVNNEHLRGLFKGRKISTTSYDKTLVKIVKDICYVTRLL